MPSRRRSDIMRPLEIEVHHCTARCVRRAYLCGKDPHTGKDYSHRRQWIIDCEKKLAGIFAIDLGFHSVMSNHIHVELRNRPDIVKTWSDEEVARRWLSATHLAKSKDGSLPEISSKKIEKVLANPEYVQEIRVRLANPSWFMAVLAEQIARRCNREDGCKGKFWEERFSSKQLTDTSAILLSGVYIDLNQVRAGEADTPEASRFTSAYDRIAAWKQEQTMRAQGVVLERPRPDAPDGWLCELTLADGPQARPSTALGSATAQRASDRGLLPVTLESYLELLDATGRMLRPDKPGSIPAELPPILKRLGIETELWMELVTHYEEWFGSIVGTSQRVVERAKELGVRWLRGQKRCAQAFG